MDSLRQMVSIDRLVMIALIAVQAATIAYLYRQSERDRADKDLLLSMIERHEAIEQTALSARNTLVVPQSFVTERRDSATSFLRARADMEQILESMFGSAGHNGDMFMPEESIARLDSLHARTIRMLEHSFDDFRLAGQTIAPGSQMGFLVVSPAMDMREFDDCYLVAVSLPRATRPELSVTLDGRVLFINGRQKGRQGTAWQFEKRVQLPGPVAAQAVRATLTNGILRIVAPKGTDVMAGDTPARIM